MKKHNVVCFLACWCLAAALGTQAWAVRGLDTPDPTLPPVMGEYMVDTATFHAIFNEAVLSSAVHAGFNNIARTPSGPDEIENFDSVLTGDVTVGSGPTVPVILTGPVTTLVRGKVGNVTGTFATEMLSMNLSGPTPFGPVMIRESPTLPSLGGTSIADLGGGMYHIDSFFDVFTELSLDGGQTWTPSQNSTRVLLCGIPEPASVVLVGLAMVAFTGLARRRD